MADEYALSRALSSQSLDGPVAFDLEKQKEAP
jgi:hypothetical protein